MAEPVQIQGSTYQGKIRNPLGVIGLSIITIGIYYLVWYFKVNKEMAEFGKARGTEEAGTSPGTSVAAFIPGFLIIVPPYVSLYRACRRLNAAERLAGVPSGMEGPLLWLLLVLIGPVGQYIFQRNLNNLLQAQAGGGGAAAIPAAPAEAPAPPAPPAESPAPPEAPPAPPQAPGS